MGNTILKLAVIGGVAYLWYKYYYLPSQQEKDKNNNLSNETIEDGRTTFYGNTKDEFVRGFPMPNKITDIKENNIYILTKPNEYVFGVNPRGIIQVQLLKDTNRMVYQPRNKDPFIAEYDKVKDKIVMTKDYTK